MLSISPIPSRHITSGHRAPHVQLRHSTARVAPRLHHDHAVICRAEPAEINDSFKDELGDLAAKIEELSRSVDDGLQVRRRYHRLFHSTHAVHQEHPSNMSKLHSPRPTLLCTASIQHPCFQP